MLLSERQMVVLWPGRQSEPEPVVDVVTYLTSGTLQVNGAIIQLLSCCRSKLFMSWNNIVAVTEEEINQWGCHSTMSCWWGCHSTMSCWDQVRTATRGPATIVPPDVHANLIISWLLMRLRETPVYNTIHSPLQFATVAKNIPIQSDTPVRKGKSCELWNN